MIGGGRRSRDPELTPDWPQSVTLYAEFLPTKQRGKCVVLLDCFWALGACLEVGTSCCYVGSNLRTNVFVGDPGDVGDAAAGLALAARPLRAPLPQLRARQLLAAGECALHRRQRTQV